MRRFGNLELVSLGNCGRFVAGNSDFRALCRVPYRRRLIKYQHFYHYGRIKSKIDRPWAVG